MTSTVVVAMSPENLRVWGVFIELGLAVVTVGGLLTFVIGIRNAAIWMRQLTGATTDAVVSKIEVTTGPRGATRRPYVEFMTLDGNIVEAPSVLYREKIRIDKGDWVRVSYSRRNPVRIAIHGYDFRLREPIGSLAGIVTAVAAAVLAFNL